MKMHHSGIYTKVREVIDIDSRYYLIGADYPRCSKCRIPICPWSMEVLKQLDPSHRNKFPAVLTTQLALDRKCVTLLKSRSAGNSSSYLQRPYKEFTARSGQGELYNTWQTVGHLDELKGVITSTYIYIHMCVCMYTLQILFILDGCLCYLCSYRLPKVLLVALQTQLHGWPILETSLAKSWTVSWPLVRELA